jgi:alpha-beta hydrolase superfamily lysophospholipase
MALDRADNRIVRIDFATEHTPLPMEALGAEAQAALRQFSLERLMSYGVSYPDAQELLCLVHSGTEWKTAALQLAQQVLARLVSVPGTATRMNILFRAAALTRMAHIMMLADTDERRTIFNQATQLFQEAVSLTPGHEKVVIQTGAKPLVSWVLSPNSAPRAAIIVIGGMEGWGMDVYDIAVSMASRGIEVWALDGPGQGESRFNHNHFFQREWRSSYQAVVAHIQTVRPDLPVGLLGNSMGGTMALEVAACEPALYACCSNGGPPRAIDAPALRPGIRQKMWAMCGPVSDEEGERIWSEVDVTAHGQNISCPVLIVHGEQDPLVSNDEVLKVFDSVGSADKILVSFGDGLHCIYNHPDDKNALIADWFLEKLPSLTDNGVTQC